MKLKILTYNIHKGFNWSNQKYVLEKIKQLISQTQSDLVFIQEVVGKNSKLKKKGHQDRQFEYLADGVWDNYSYAQNAVYGHGHHGNLILSKYPISDFKNIDLSTNAFEKRGLLVATISIPHFGGKKIYALCTHLNLLNSGRMIQYGKIKDEILSRVGSGDSICILAGDFNDWNQKAGQVFEEELQMKEAHREIHGELAKTYPAIFPFLSLDRIYLRGGHYLHAKTLTGHSWPSDHLPLYCECKVY